MAKTRSTESFIESVSIASKEKSVILNPNYLDDENLPEDERTEVLREIFNRNIREKQLGRIIAHLVPVINGDQAHSAALGSFGLLYCHQEPKKNPASHRPGL